MLLPTETGTRSIRKSAQRLRWFVDAFERQVARTEAETGNRYDVDRSRLTEVFAEWLKSFEAQKPDRDEVKPAYVGFAAGLMLRTLIRREPVTATRTGGAADEENPARFWPEGYLYVAFCLNVRKLVLQSDYNAVQSRSEMLDDPRVWWSFRENVAEDPSLAIPFLDLFAGEEPRWTAPELFQPNTDRELLGSDGGRRPQVPSGQDPA